MNKNEVNLQDIQEESREQDTPRLVDMSYTEEELAELPFVCSITGTLRLD